MRRIPVSTNRLKEEVIKGFWTGSYRGLGPELNFQCAADDFLCFAAGFWRFLLILSPCPCLSTVEVMYNCEGFLQKNIDKPPEDFIKLIPSSSSGPLELQKRPVCIAKMTLTDLQSTNFRGLRWEEPTFQLWRSPHESSTILIRLIPHIFCINTNYTYTCCFHLSPYMLLYNPIESLSLFLYPWMVANLQPLVGRRLELLKEFGKDSEARVDGCHQLVMFWWCTPKYGCFSK